MSDQAQRNAEYLVTLVSTVKFLTDISSFAKNHVARGTERLPSQGAAVGFIFAVRSFLKS